MPSITINGHRCEFTQGQTILQIAQAANVAIPSYCYHAGLSIVASCRICLAEVWAPNPKTGQLEPFMGGKLVPTCQQTASDGMVVYSDSPKAVANQKAVMEYLLINHPLDCPVCDQAGECLLQDFSYEYGRGVSRFQEQKVKQPKKDLGPHIYLYADRCIMCTRCVRFTREVTGTGELHVLGRGNKEEIDVFPGVPIANDLSANVVDLCPVGALLDKDFLFTQRVWFLKETASIDPITASGDNIWVHHNDGKVFRVKPRENPAVNKWWITDEVRYGWKFIDSEDRIQSPRRRQYGVQVDAEWNGALDAAVDGLRARAGSGRLALVVSPMLSCEDAYLLASFARAIDPQAVLAVGPVPRQGEDRTYPPGKADGFRVYAEKAPNARGVRRVLEALANGAPVLEYDALLARLGKGSGRSDVSSVIVTGNYPSSWASDDLLDALGGKFTIVIDTLESDLSRKGDVVLPGATFAEKAGTFENARGMIQAFDQAISPRHLARPEGQIAIDLMNTAHAGKVPPGALDGSVSVARTYMSGSGGAGSLAGIINPQESGPTRAGGPLQHDLRQVLYAAYNAANVRTAMAAASPALGVFVTGVSRPTPRTEQTPEMSVVEL